MLECGPGKDPEEAPKGNEGRGQWIHPIPLGSPEKLFSILTPECTPVLLTQPPSWEPSISAF